MVNGLLGDLSSRALGEGERMFCLFVMCQRPKEPRACESHRPGWTGAIGVPVDGKYMYCCYSL